jgi:hypothetical protein
MTTVFFVERPSEAVAVQKGESLVVAITGSAQEALEARGIAHTPISALADSRALAGLEVEAVRAALDITSELERFVRRWVPTAPLGFLTDDAYRLAFSIGTLAYRTLMLRGALDSSGATTARLFAGAVHEWFANDGYARDPWIDALQASGARVEVFDAPPSVRLPGLADVASEPLARRMARAAVRLGTRRHPIPTDLATKLAGTRVLAADSYLYDWEPVLEHLSHLHGVEIRRLPPLDDISTADDDHETGAIADAFASWLTDDACTPQLTFHDLDILPALVPHLRAVTIAGSSTARRADALVNDALDCFEPDVCCGTALSSLASGRLARACAARGTSLLSYQHGGSYGTQRSPTHELSEVTRAASFLTYGAGVRINTDGTRLPSAAVVPVGSARIERLRTTMPRRRFRASRQLRILWIGEIATRNAVGAWYSTEDTERYALERDCLGRLMTSNAALTYRPFPGQIELSGIPRWLSRTNPEVGLSSTGTVHGLIAASDVVISDLSSSTTWYEVLALDTPLILYCDPRQTLLTSEFQAALEHACHWCRTGDELRTACTRLSDEGARFVEELRRIDSREFLRDYVLHRDDGRCVERALERLADARAPSPS